MKSNYFEKISWKAIIIGAITDVGGSNLWGIVLGIYLAAKYHLTTDSASRLQMLLAHDSFAVVSGWVIGSGFSIFGGYIAARVAKHDELLNATLASFLCIAFVLFSISATASTSDILIGLIGNPLLAFVGGYIRLRQVRHKSS